MREIGFRVYIKPLKRYAKGYETILYHHQCNMKPTWTVNISPEEYYGDEDLIIEQDTGLKDQNGKKIYEGDIVTLNGEWEEIEKDDCKVITFKDGCFRVGDDYEDEAGMYLSDWRVIGNIHENGDLLKGVKWY